MRARRALQRGLSDALLSHPSSCARLMSSSSRPSSLVCSRSAAYTTHTHHSAWFGACGRATYYLRVVGESTQAPSAVVRGDETQNPSVRCETRAQLVGEAGRGRVRMGGICRRGRGGRDAWMRVVQRGGGEMQVSRTGGRVGAASEVGGTFDWYKGRADAQKRTRERPGQARRWH